MYFSDNHIKNRSHLQAFCSSMAILELRVSPIIRIKPAESLYGSHAMAKTSLEMLAEVPQIEKRTFWRLRNSRKSKRERFGVCGTPANQKKNVLALAEVPRGISKNTLAVISLYPSHSSGIRSPILSFKLTLQRFLEREIRRRGHPFRSDRSLGGHTLLRSISEVPI